MVTMTALETGIPIGKTLTAYDVAELPDDGNRYELIDGVLDVVPSPSPDHQWVVARLLQALLGAQPSSMMTFPAPFDILADDTAVQPDIIVTASDLPREASFRALPLLAVEILSPSTAVRDLNTKFRRYERAGIQSYWVVDPLDPRLIAWGLRNGRYTKVADVRGEEAWTAAQPFEVTITPAQLLV